MENRKRNIQIKFRVTEKERELIEKKMAQLPIHKIGAYMRKMAIDDYIIYTDLSPIKEYAKAIRRKKKAEYSCASHPFCGSGRNQKEPGVLSRLLLDYNWEELFFSNS